MESGAPGAIRTRDQRIRNPLLYPTELRAQRGEISGGRKVAQAPVLFSSNLKIDVAPGKTCVMMWVSSVSERGSAW